MVVDVTPAEWTPRRQIPSFQPKNAQPGRSFVEELLASAAARDDAADLTGRLERRRSKHTFDSNRAVH